MIAAAAAHRPFPRPVAGDHILSPARGRSASRQAGFAASFLVHAAFATTLLLMPVARTLPRIPVDPVEVEIVTPPSPAPTPARLSPSRPQPAPGPATRATPAAPAAPAQAPSRPQQPAMVRPTHMLSGAILDDPSNRDTREVLASLMDDEQIIQLCSLEAMEQVAAWKPAFVPELLVAHAMKDTRLSGTALIAEGAAFYSKGAWYNIKFRCDVTADRKSVTAFAFLVGEPIPRSEWESHDLPPDTFEE